MSDRETFLRTIMDAQSLDRNEVEQQYRLKQSILTFFKDRRYYLMDKPGLGGRDHDINVLRNIIWKSSNEKRIQGLCLNAAFLVSTLTQITQQYNQGLVPCIARVLETYVDQEFQRGLDDSLFVFGDIINRNSDFDNFYALTFEAKNQVVSFFWQFKVFEEKFPEKFLFYKNKLLEALRELELNYFQTFFQQNHQKTQKTLSLGVNQLTSDIPQFPPQSNQVSLLEATFKNIKIYENQIYSLPNQPFGLDVENATNNALNAMRQRIANEQKRGGQPQRDSPNEKADSALSPLMLEV